MDSADTGVLREAIAPPYVTKNQRPTDRKIALQPTPPWMPDHDA
jgi:hypothetical protein